jgi:predicted enzyme related to lactoylglutathione lyase
MQAQATQNKYIPMKVEALGGIFIYSENPKVLADWYSTHFGLTYEYTEQHQAYYVTFPYKEKTGTKERYTIFSILYSNNRPLIDGKFFTINLRVSGIHAIIEKLSEQKIEVRGPEAHDEGVFAWVNDPEGNFIELWEEVIA